MVDSKTIGRRIRALRKEKGLSTFSLALAIGVTDSAIRGYESGERVARDEIKVKIANFFGKSVQEIFFDED